MKTNWFALADPTQVASPALLFHPARIAANIQRMIRMAGGTERLRPHVKTHKCGMISIMLLAQGITRFKCATIAEAAMLGECVAPDVLLATQPVGPNLDRFIELIRRYPDTAFSVIADEESCLRALSAAAAAAGVVLPVWLDMDCGMHRTGIAPDDRAMARYRLMADLPGLEPAGLHTYDGHIRDRELSVRRQHCEEAFAPVAQLREQLVAAGLPVPAVVAGGTPSFPVHAQRPEVQCAPGTCVLWDFGYADQLPDLEFEVGAVLFTRVVSKPGGNRLCLDLGHKAVAAENPPPRVRFLNLPDAQEVLHSEEHLVVETAEADRFAVGDCLYGVPRHICPTVALYDFAEVVAEGEVVDRWRISARGRG